MDDASIRFLSIAFLYWFEDIERYMTFGVSFGQSVLPHPCTDYEFSLAAFGLASRMVVIV